MAYLNEWIEYAARFIEVTAVVIMLGIIIIETVKWLFLSGKGIGNAYEGYRAHLGKALLLSIELLVAADIIRTVVLEATLQNIATLGLLVLVRTFLGWTLSVEVEGRWPWQKRQAASPGTAEGMDASTSQSTAVPAGARADEKERSIA